MSATKCRKTASGGPRRSLQPGSRSRRLAFPTAVLWGVAVIISSAVPVQAAVDFRRDIEPLLVKRCSECHGPDAQKGGLRLDRKAEAFRGGKSGKPGLVAGRPQDSEIFRRVSTEDADDVMPPKGERLTAEQVEWVRAWVAAGADWPEDDPARHWSLRKPLRPEVPQVAGEAWPRNEIDRWILARLEREGLEPSAEADRYTLARRVSLDLTGLPPVWEDVAAWVTDESPEAYERWVDRLLASVHYGEHMARWWLDLARYADSNGYQVDLARSVWPYRDWVIRAFNRNQPFDQFTIEQMAGDLLPNPTLEQRIATGFHRNTKINDEGGGDAEEYRTKAVKDRVATTATTWLGLTMACAECHTHKYDPISHEEYYRFYAFFNNTTDGGNYSVEPTVAVWPPEVRRRRDYLQDRLRKVQAELAEVERRLPTDQMAWEDRWAGRTNVWTILDLTQAISTGGASYTNLSDQSLLATGVNPIYDTILVEAKTALTNLAAVRLEVLPHPSLPKGGPGRWDQTGNFILDEFALQVAPLEDATRETANPAADFGEAKGAMDVAFHRAAANWEQDYYRAEHAVDGNPKTGWAIGPKFGQPHFLVAEAREGFGFAGGTRLRFRFEHYHGNSHTLGRLRLSVTGERNPELWWPVPPEVAAVLAVPRAERSADQQRCVAAHYRSISGEVRRLEREWFRLNQREAETAAAKYTSLVLQERTEPRETYVHLRGDFLARGKGVTPGVPAVLPPLPVGEPPNRLTLARWLVDPANPLTARVTVNRLWERFFGTGLVKTSEDFGRQGEAPSHPELLDWMATELVRLGWDLKALQKQIVMSATYRQSALTTAAALEKDFYNRWLARGPRFRMDAEMIRDQALHVSGLLVPEVGGPSVYPVQVPNLWKEIGFLRPEIGMDEWPVSEGPDLYRRGLYTFWRRVCTYPTFATFDAPSREVCAARRPRTNTPLQALAGLNEPTLLEAARVLAQRVASEGGPDVNTQIEYAFRTTLSRPPTAAERTRLAGFFEQQRRSYASDPAAAERLLQVGSWPRPDGVDPVRLAAWMMVANVLLNLDETLTKG